MSIKGQGHSLTLVRGHSDFKVKRFTFGLYTQVSDSGPHGPLVIFPPCFIRFVRESARTTKEPMRHALSDARGPCRGPDLSHQMSQGIEKPCPDQNSNPGPLPIRETTDLLSQELIFDILSMLNQIRPRIFSEQRRYQGGLFDARCPSHEPTLATKCHKGDKYLSPTGTRTQGLSLSVRQLSC